MGERLRIFPKYRAGTAEEERLDLPNSRRVFNH